MSVQKTGNKWLAITIMAASFSMSSNAFAHYPSAWSDSDGNVILDGSGDCLRTINYKDGGCSSTKHSHEGVEHEHKDGLASHNHAATAPVVLGFAREPFNLESEAAFTSSGSELSAEGQLEVQAFATKLEGHSVSKITIEGYTDDRGPASFNQELSEKRAASVKDAMISNGIDANIITVIGHGESNPVADNETSAGRAKNRRVTVTVEGLE